MKKYGIQVKMPDYGYLWMIDDTTAGGDVGPLVFNTKEEANDYAEKMSLKLYKVDIYPYKEWEF